MILLTELDNVRAAQGFIDYLKTQQLQAQLKKGEQQQVAIWVAPEAYSQAESLWQEFCQNPDQEKYLTASWHTGTSEPPMQYTGTSFDLKKRFNQLSWFNRSIALICIALYLAFIFGGFPTLFPLLQFDAANPINWFTPAIVHFSVIHIVFNLMWWLQLGSQIERNLGVDKLIILFLLTALISNWTQFLVVGDNFGGLSGVVYGLLGFCWVYGWYRPESGVAVGKPIIVFMVGWMLLGFADVLAVSMANWAHLFGLLSGMLGGLVVVLRSKIDSRMG